MEHLFDKLSAYAQGDNYPYHMPGHKRKGFGMLPEEWYKFDITEIDGFDNLHQPEDILHDLQGQAARLYGAEESFYLVNGSTCGILSAISSALPFGGHILMARNCHKSAYHAAYLRQLQVTYLYPPYLQEYDILEAIESWQVRQALERWPDIEAVLVVSPTYEGRIANISAIADIVHERGIPLIVDEAHGAHLGLAEGFPPNSCQSGADLVIHSVHKTLPALTQTALLHVNGELIDRAALRRFLRIYQTSSPSYPLMASIDNALWYVERLGEERFLRFRKRYGRMCEELARCRHLRFLPPSQGRQDIGKLVVSVKQTALTGRQLYDILLHKYHLQPEMASMSFVLAMFTMNDGEDAYRRMTEALLEIDSDLEAADHGAGKCRLIGKPCPGVDAGGKPPESLQGDLAPGRGEPLGGRRNFMSEGPGGGKKRNPPDGTRNRIGEAAWAKIGRDALPLAEAWDSPAKLVPLADSVGRRMGEFINLYPPGVPLLVPGERMTEGMCRCIQDAIAQGLKVQGVQTQCKTRNGQGGTDEMILVLALTDVK